MHFAMMCNMPVMTRLYTVREVGEVLRLSPFSVRRHISQGSLKAIKLPHGQLRIAEYDLRSFLDEGGDGDR